MARMKFVPKPLQDNRMWADHAHPIIYGDQPKGCLFHLENGDIILLQIGDKPAAYVTPSAPRESHHVETGSRFLLDFGFDPFDPEAKIVRLDVPAGTWDRIKKDGLIGGEFIRKPELHIQVTPQERRSLGLLLDKIARASINDGALMERPDGMMPGRNPNRKATMKVPKAPKEPKPKPPPRLRGRRPGSGKKPEPN